MSALRRVTLPKDADPSAIARAFEQLISAVRAALPVEPTILKNVELVTGDVNVVPHKLGNRKLTKWVIVRKRSAAEIIDYQDANPSPHLTLWLFTDADVTVDIEVA